MDWNEFMDLKYDPTYELENREYETIKNLKIYSKNYEYQEKSQEKDYHGLDMPGVKMVQ